MSITLPKDPLDGDFEDCLVACLRKLGYFTESSVTLREDKIEVLEIDAIATPSSKDWCKRQLFEAKSGSWGFADLFKVLGWQRYVGIDTATLVHRGGVSHSEAFAAFTAKTGLKTFQLDPKGKAWVGLAEPVRAEPPGKIGPALASATWYGLIGQRLAHAEFYKYCKAVGATPWAIAAKTYHNAVRESVFAPTALDRARQLYEAWQASPKLPGQAVTELAASSHMSENDLWQQLENTNQHLWLQHIMILDHRSRISIIKNALDHIICDEATGKSSGPLEMLAAFLPMNFITGLEHLRGYSHREQIPFLYQIFIESFGGYYCHTSETDLALLAAMTGVPAADIPGALDSLNKFFAWEKDWFIQQKELRRLRLVPGLLLGTGAFLRQSALGLTDYNTAYPKQGFLLSMWHNALYKTLDPVLKAK
jgi:hypothetical protein